MLEKSKIQVAFKPKYFLILGICSIFLQSCQEITGKIIYPHSGEVLGTTIECRGNITGSILGKHVWLLVSETRESGERNYWPKEPITYIDRDGNWSANIFEDVPEKKFTSLYVSLMRIHTHYLRIGWKREPAQVLIQESQIFLPEN